MKHIISIAITLMICASAIAQTGESVPADQSAPRDTSSRRAKGLRASSITGRVINEAGQPLAGTVIGLNEVGKRQAGHRSVSSDDEGRFHIENLAPGNYTFAIRVPGYTTPTDLADKYYRPGDVANITLTKGGVITGTVTNAAGEPLVLANVRVFRMRELDGRPVAPPSWSERITDDRGVYRFYGLRPGTYLVVSGGRGVPAYNLRTPFEEDVATYYPSSTQDTATEVTVGSGEEANGIDIRYRGERGRAVSGKMTGVPASDSQRGGIVTLINASSQTIEREAYLDTRNPSFAFYGLPDGEYQVFGRVATRDNEPGLGSPLVPVKIKGADVTGIAVNVAPFGSIAGQLVIETAPPELRAKCDEKKQITTEETIIYARADDKDTMKRRSPPFWVYPLRSAINEKGEFYINDTEAGRFYMGAAPLDDALYIRAVTLAASAQSSAPIDAAKSGVSIKQGARITGLTITTAEGAANLSGQITPAAEGARLPDGIRVHLIPAEKESAENVLRFYETSAQRDGSFSIKNIAPGRYRIITRLAPDEDATEARPAARDQAERRKLRAEAEAANSLIELEPCQRVSDYKLRFAPAAKTTGQKN